MPASGNFLREPISVMIAFGSGRGLPRPSERRRMAWPALGPGPDEDVFVVPVLGRRFGSTSRLRVPDGLEVPPSGRHQLDVLVLPFDRRLEVQNYPALVYFY